MPQSVHEQNWKNMTPFKILNDLLERSSAQPLWKIQVGDISVEVFRTYSAGDWVVTIAKDNWNLYRKFTGNNSEVPFILCAENFALRQKGTT